LLMEIVYNALTFNVGWFLNLFTGNLLWLLMMYIGVHILKNGQRVLYNNLVIWLVVTGTMDLARISGLSFYVAEALMVVYLMRLSVIALLEGSPGGMKYFSLAWVLTFWVTLVIYNVFMR